MHRMARPHGGGGRIAAGVGARASRLGARDTIVVACLPPVWWCLQLVFHPQDLLAMGFVFAAMACACRGRWIGAGILVALAVLTQQFRAPCGGTPVCARSSQGKDLLCRSSADNGSARGPSHPDGDLRNAPRAITLGTGDNVSIGGTLVWELRLYGAPLVLLSRVTPIAVSVALAWWVSRRLGPAALQPATLVSVMAISLGLRLVFEKNLFPYYLMALAVSLVLLDVVRGMFAVQRLHG